MFNHEDETPEVATPAETPEVVETPEAEAEESTPEERVLVFLASPPLTDEFVSSCSLVIDRNGTLVPASEVDQLVAEAAAYGVALRIGN